MKAHIGVDAGSGYIHTVTPANAHDITQASELIREDDETVYGLWRCRLYRDREASGDKVG